MGRPRNMLQLRLHEPATPAHVERAGRLFAQALDALGVSDVGVTLVIENHRFIGTLRTRTPSAAAGVQSIIDLVQRPIGALSDSAVAVPPELADALATYARDEHKARPELWQPTRSGGKHLCTMDETFANVMDVLARSPPIDSQRVRGTTYVYTRVLRIGRVDERQALKARLVLDGRPLDVPLAEGLAPGPFFDAARNEQVVRVRLRAAWLYTSGQRPVIHDASVIGIDETRAPATGAQVVEFAHAQSVIGADDLPALLSSIDRDGEKDE